MKLAKLSLAAMVVAGLASSSFAADTLADAFKNGKVSGELKAWYFDKTAEGTAQNNENITDFAVELGYVTDSLYGFRMGVTFQGAAQPWSEKNADTVFKDDQNAGGSVLSEAYLGYKLGKTDVKVGRQYIATPLVSGSGSRIFKESFEGATIVNTDLPQTTLIAIYVNKFQGRTGNINKTAELGDAPDFTKKANFGSAGNAVFEDAYTLGVINKSITNLTLTAQYALVTDVAGTTTYGDVDVYYAEANYELPVAGFKLGLDANYRASNTEYTGSADDFSGHYAAARISVKDLAGFGFSFAAGTVDNDSSTIQGMGNGPTSYTSTLIRGTSKVMKADTDSYLFQATYDFSKVGVTGLSALAQYGWSDQGTVAGNIDYTSVAGGLTYVVPALKGLTTSLQYETEEKDTAGTKTDTDELWFKAGYKF